MVKALYLKDRLNSELKFLNKLHPGNRQAKIFTMAISKKIFHFWNRFSDLNSLCLAINFQK